MRFKEFSRVDEVIPAVGTIAANAVRSALKKPISNVNKKVNDFALNQMNKQQSTQSTTTQAQQGQTSQASQNQENPNQDVIPKIGAEITLPDKETNKMTPYLIKSIKGPEIELEPNLKQQPNQPRVSIKVNQKDLMNTLNTINNMKSGS